MPISNLRKTPVIAFVGRSGCGKTTVLENVVPLLLQRSIRLGIVKHTWHRDIESDMPGTDTRRMWDLGVPSVTLVSTDRVVHWQRSDDEPQLDQVLTAISDVELVILEGFKGAPVPKIEVLRQVHHTEPLPNLGGRVAFVTDVVTLETDLPCFALDDYQGVADFLIRFRNKT
jgi:molybdopterin-guanine dinucleotide biosynthesis protein B